MHPTLFQIGAFAVGTHNAFMALGAIVGAIVFYLECRRRGELSEQMLWIAAGCMIAGAIGGKLSAIFGNIGDPSLSTSDVIFHGGRSILGGLTGGYLGVVFTKRMVRYHRPTGDLFAPATALGCAVGRIGCFLTELPGTPTTLPWGIRLHPEAVIRLPNCPSWCWTSPLHPSMLYESVFQLLMFLLLWTRLRFVSALDGELMKLYLLCYAIFRFFVEFVRGNEIFRFGLTRHQLFLIPVIILLAGYFIRWNACRSAGAAALAQGAA
jgi:prolipoprotein diacylglyceryl transferase